MSGSLDRIANAQQCPYCRQWITLPLRRARAAFDAHKRQCQTPAERAAANHDRTETIAALTEAAATVKRASLWDGVQDTHQTEAELNGFRATQGALL